MFFYPDHGSNRQTFIHDLATVPSSLQGKYKTIPMSQLDGVSILMGDPKLVSQKREIILA